MRYCVPDQFLRGGRFGAAPDGALRFHLVAGLDDRARIGVDEVRREHAAGGRDHALVPHERIAAFKARLNLDEAQTARIKTLLEAGDEEDDMVSKAIAGQSTLPAAPGEAAKKRADLESQISSLLKPEQAAAFTEVRQEQRENRIEVATGREMTRLQQSLTLSPAQKDQVYQALATISTSEEDSGNSGITIDPEQIKARRQARLEALKPILTPEQFSTYERSSGSLINHEGSVISIEEAPAE